MLNKSGPRVDRDILNYIIMYKLHQTGDWALIGRDNYEQEIKKSFDAEFSRAARSGNKIYRSIAYIIFYNNPK